MTHKNVSKSIGNIDRFRQEWEADGHWQMREKFILKYHHMFDEDKLGCLSQLYYNVAVLGCVYPPKVMKNLNGLIEGLEENHLSVSKETFREKWVKTTNELSQQREATLHGSFKRPMEENRPPIVGVLQHKKVKFVPAQSTTQPQPESKTNFKPRRTAASFFTTELARTVEVTGKIPEEPEIITLDSSDSNIVSDEDEMEVLFEKTLQQKKKIQSRSKNESQIKITSMDAIENAETNDIKIDVKPALLAKLVPFKNVIISNRTKITCLISLIHNSADRGGFLVDWRFKQLPERKKNVPEFECEFVFEGFVLSTAVGNNKKAAKNAAARSVIEKIENGTEGSWGFIPKRIDHFEVEKIIKPIENKLSVPKPARVVQRNLGMLSRRQIRKINRRKKKNQSSDFVILEVPGNNSISSLESTASFNYVKLELKETDESSWTVQLGGNLVGTYNMKGVPKSELRSQVSTLALNDLKKRCYSIVVKKPFSSVGTEVTKQTLDGNGKEAAISNDNIGNKLLRMMGWTGGGLGKTGEGIAEPVKATAIRGRKGLGTEVSCMSQFQRRMGDVIKDYALSHRNDDLIFSPEFSNEERLFMHFTAHKYGLKTRSRGKGEKRFMVMSKKMAPQSLVQFLIENGGSTDKYQLIAPRQ